MGWVFDKELGVKRVPDSEAPAKPEPVTFNGMDCSLLAARYVAHRQAAAMMDAGAGDKADDKA